MKKDTNDLNMQARISARKLAAKVLPIYIILGWRWASGEITEEAIYKSLMKMYHEIKGRDTYRSTGGLTVQCDEEGDYEMSFSVTEIVPNTMAGRIDMEYWDED